MKIITNTTASDILLHGVTITPSEVYTIPKQDYANWTDVENYEVLITDGDITVSNGVYTLAADVAIEHLRTIQGVSSIHEVVDIQAGIGTSAPALYEVGPAVIGYEVEIGDKISSVTKYDKIAGSTVFFEIHCCIDNNVADRWVAFDLYIRTTTGHADVQMDGYDLTATFGPFEVPTTPFQIFKVNGQLPSSLYTGGREYSFSAGTRIDVAPLGKTNPTNNPIVLRICKIYYKKGV